MHAEGVATEAEEHPLPEGEHAATSPGDRDAHRHDGEAEVLGEQLQPELAQRRRCHDQQRHRRGGEARRVEPARVNVSLLTSMSWREA